MTDLGAWHSSCSRSRVQSRAQTIGRIIELAEHDTMHNIGEQSLSRITNTTRKNTKAELDPRAVTPSLETWCCHSGQVSASINVLNFVHIGSRKRFRTSARTRVCRCRRRKLFSSTARDPLNANNSPAMADNDETEGPSHKRKISETDFGSPALDKPRKKPIACRPCHARKIKCSFGHPCEPCQQAKREHECDYPKRDQKITVNSSYVEKLLAENRRLREQSENLDGHAEPPATIASINVSSSPMESGDARNPLLHDRSWFFPLGSTGPIHISEAADAAFATRFRETLAEDGKAEHIPRTDYMTDGKLMGLADKEMPWPPLARARLLVKAAFDTVGSCYHCCRKSEVYNGLKRHYRDPTAPRTIFTCKLEALFALGEAYSCRTQSISEDTFPGLGYFARASRTLRGTRERPQIDHIEVLLLLSLYSLLLNRRHGAYYLASSAVRSSIIMGLHQNVPELQVPDRAAREHRIRIWWTAYTLERLWASKMGHPISVQDDDIGVDLPSDTGLSDVEAADFLDVEYANASIRLAQLSRHIISSIYNRKSVHGAFSQRVQLALKDLRSWVESLPKHLQIPAGGLAHPLQRPQKWLHLSFNQYVILSTRPILLHVLRAHKQLWNDASRTKDLKKEIGETPLALAEACIRCARHSHRLLTDTWIDGSFAIYDYTYTQYLFSAATILAISSISIGQNDDSDKDGFDSASQFLDQLKQNGNYAAREFCQHLQAIKLSLNTFRNPTNADTFNAFALPFPQPPFTPSNTTPGSTFQPTMTAEMALAEPSLQDFLTHSDFDPGFLDTQIQGDQFQGFYYPMLQDEAWFAG